MGTMRYGVSVSAVLLLLTGFLSAEGTPEQEDEAAPEGTVEYIEGEVMIEDRPAHTGMTVTEGARVVTGEASRCDIVFGGKNVIRIFSDSKVRLDLPRGEIDVEHGALGAVFHRLKSLVADGERFILTSPTVAAGVRGTAFYIRSRNPEETYFCTCRGRIDLEDPDGEHRRETANANHGAYWYRKTDGTFTTETATLLYHDDAAMNAIAERIDEEIPWGTLPE